MNVLKLAKRFGGKMMVVAKRNAPEICLVVGGVAGIAALYFTRKGAKNEDEIIEAHLEERKAIQTSNFEPVEARKATAKLYGKTILKLGKNYAPAIACELISLGCGFCGYKVQKNTNAGLLAIANGLAGTVNLYEQKFKNVLGEEKFNEIMNDIKTEKVEVGTDANGESSTETKKIFKDPNEYSVYAKFFDEFNPNWKKNPDLNLIFLKGVQAECNDILKSRGFLFLNEVYDALGLPMTSYGQLVGWIMGNGDDFVDFGIMDGYRASCRDFVNGLEPSILLDFNVDGVIYDKI